MVEAVAVPDAERAQHERDRGKQEEGDRPDDDPVDREPAPAGGPRGGPPGTSRAAETPLEHPGDDHDRGDRGELKEGERRGRAQVEEARGLVVDLRLERRVADPAEDDDHPERGEAEEEHDRRGRRQRRREQRDRQPQVPLRRPCAERRGRVPEPLVETRPKGADHAHDDRDVEEDVRDQDRPHRSLDPVREERDERGGDDDRRQDERDEHEGLYERAPSEREPRERPGERQSREQRQDGGDRRLPEREPGDLARRRGGEDVERQVERPVHDEAPTEDRDQRPREEQGEERERPGDGRRPRGALRRGQRTTMSVHAASHRSRFASISLAGSASGSFGTSACFTNASGSETPCRTG